MRNILFKIFIAGMLLCLSVSFVFAQQENPVVIGNARFTFITSGLVRLEYALNGNFLDDSTLFAVNRKVTYKDIKIESPQKDFYIISSPLIKIEYRDNGFPFGQVNLNVKYQHNDKERNWKTYMGTKSGNLLGAIETLDNVRGSVERQEGLLSRNGWYAIFDSNKEVLKNGWIQQRSPDHIQDIYLFVYGNDYKSALKSLQTISGHVPMTRKYVHGSWYCRWWDYTADDYRQLVQEYKEHDFPLDIMVFDMGWHTQKATAGTGHAGNVGWTGYSWNRKLIPDPAKLIEEFKNDGVYVVLNEHPHDGLRNHDDAYPEFMTAMGADTAGQKNIIFNAGDRKYMDNFMKYAHKESDDMGTAFWWLDWQQDYVYPIVRGTNMKHLPWLNHIYYNYSKQNGLRGAGFSRWAGWGDHRHPIQFSGDAVGNWDMLKFQIDLTTSSGNAGCFFWAHDIGGFFDGKNPELYTRWTQFGLLNSSLRIHSVLSKDLDRRPWLWGEKYEKAMKDIYHMRSQLMPYIYSSVWQCHKDMLPLNRGMYIEYSEKEAYSNPQQFMFGDLLLGAPITQPTDSVTGLAEQTVWLPAGNTWYNMFTGEKHEGGQTITEKCTINEFPMYIKGGYPLPMQPYTQRMATDALTKLLVRCYPGNEGDNNSYTLYEDDGITTQYEKGFFAETKIEYRKNGGKTEIIVNPVEGKYEGQPSKRGYIFELPCTPEKLNATVNGKKVKVVYSKKINGNIIEVQPQDISKKIVLSTQY